MLSLSYAAPRIWRTSTLQRAVCSKASAMKQTTQTGEFAQRKVGAEVIDLSVGQGYPSFRKALAEFLEPEHQCVVKADELLAVGGASHGLDLVCSNVARPGDVVLVEAPTYFLARGIFETRGLQPMPMPMDEQGIDVEALEKLLDDPGTTRPRLLYLIPVHNNPRATVLPPARRRRLIELAHKHNFVIVADEVYQLLTFPGSPAPPPAMRAFEEEELRGSAGSRVISVGSFSKIMAPGLRLGWLEASPHWLDVLKRDGVLCSGGAFNPLAAGMMHSALELGLLQRHLHGTIRPALAERAAALCTALRLHVPSASFLQPQGGYFVWLTLTKQVNARELLKGAAARRKVAFTPGEACGGCSHHLRLSFSFYSPEELEEAAQRLGAAVQEHLDGLDAT